MAGRFPEDFLWGASSSAFQIGGGWDEGRKGMTVADHNSFKRSHRQIDSEVADDFYDHWKEDIALMKELDMRIYRFSFSWTRIIPDRDGEVNQQGIASYNDMTNCLLKHRTRPFMTLYHSDLPYALVRKYNGWEDRRCVYAFERCTRICFGQYGDRVKYWQVINEQNLMIRMDERMNISEADPLKADQIRAQANYRMFLIHALASKTYHELVKGGKVGPAVSSIYTCPLTDKPEDVWAARINDCMKTVCCLDMHYYEKYPGYYMRYLSERGTVPVMMGGDREILKYGRVDYIALNYYRTLCASYLPADGSHPVDMRVYRGNEVGFGQYGYCRDEEDESLATSGYGAQIDPMGLRVALNDYYSRYHVSLVITENELGMGDGLAADDQAHDPYGIDYIEGYSKTCSLTIQNGVDLIGYSSWSSMDLLGPHRSFKKKYGFVYVNREGMSLKGPTRIKKDSLYWYQNVIWTNGEGL